MKVRFGKDVSHSLGNLIREPGAYGDQDFHDRVNRFVRKCHSQEFLRRGLRHLEEQLSKCPQQHRQHAVLAILSVIHRLELHISISLHQSYKVNSFLAQRIKVLALLASEIGGDQLSTITAYSRYIRLRADPTIERMPTVPRNRAELWNIWTTRQDFSSWSKHLESLMAALDLQVALITDLLSDTKQSNFGVTHRSLLSAVVLDSRLLLNDVICFFIYFIVFPALLPRPDESRYQEFVGRLDPSDQFELWVSLRKGALEMTDQFRQGWWKRNSLCSSDMVLQHLCDCISSHDRFHVHDSLLISEVEQDTLPKLDTYYFPDNTKALTSMLKLHTCTPPGSLALIRRAVELVKPIGAAVSTLGSLYKKLRTQDPFGHHLIHLDASTGLPWNPPSTIKLLSLAPPAKSTWQTVPEIPSLRLSETLKTKGAADVFAINQSCARLPYIDFVSSRNKASNPPDTTEQWHLLKMPLVLPEEDAWQRLGSIFSRLMQKCLDTQSALKAVQPKARGRSTQPKAFNRAGTVTYVEQPTVEAPKRSISIPPSTNYDPFQAISSLHVSARVPKDKALFKREHSVCSSRDMRRLSSVSPTPPSVTSVTTAQSELKKADTLQISVNGPVTATSQVNRALSGGSVRQDRKAKARPSRSRSSSRPREYKVKHTDLTWKHKIGSGSSASVYLGEWRGTPVAVKSFKGTKLDDAWERELLTVLKLRHPNLVLVLGYTNEQYDAVTREIVKPFCIISEYCAGGTLFHALHKNDSYAMTWRQRLKILFDVSVACRYLHSVPLIHRDLKSLNILLDQPISSPDQVPVAKLSDFGMCVVNARGRAGTYQWMAPEVYLMRETQSEKQDVYSFGMVMYEVLTSSLPFAELVKNPREGARVAQLVATSCLRPNLKLLPVDTPRQLQDLMEHCWQRDPDKRPHFGTISNIIHAVLTR